MPNKSTPKNTVKTPIVIMTCRIFFRTVYFAMKESVQKGNTGEPELSKLLQSSLVNLSE